MRTKIETKKYVLAFVITSLVFIGALIVSNRISENRLAEVKAIENKIALDILSSETQFALLRESSCRAIDHSTAFSEELNSLTQKLSYMEQNLGADNAEVLNLKKYHSLLQVKDYLLVKQVNEKCGIKPITIIYFYTNQENCEECKKEGYVLTKLREEFPELRIYSFDYNLDSSVVKTMKSIYSIENTMPALVINEEAYYGFKDIADIEKLIPQLKKLREVHAKEAAAKSATSTKE
jgi:hypothetical protein